MTTVVSDPEYLTTELVTSSQFKKEASRGAWNPRPCDIAPPLRGPAPRPPRVEINVVPRAAALINAARLPGL